MSFPSTHPLGIDDHTDVYEAFEGISAKWDLLAIHLDVGRNAVEKIKSDHSGVERRLSAVLDEWLRKKLTGSARVPSWKWLCEGVDKIDRGLAEAVIRQHQCGCVQCSGVSLPLKCSLEPPEQKRYDTLLADAVNNKNCERIRQSVEAGGNPFSYIPGTSNTIFSFAAENKEVFECLKSVYVHHHHTGDHAVDILHPHYDEIYSRLGNPLEILDMLHRESVISKIVLLQATPKRRDLQEHIITIIEQAVRSNHHNLQAVALIFKKYDCLFDIGDTLLKAFNQVFDIPYDLVPSAEKSTDTFRIREFYRSEFGKFFGKRALLYDEVRKIMKKRKLSLEKLTKFLFLYNRDLKNDIKRCKSIRDVIDVMRSSTSITDTSLLETVAIRFSLDEVLKLLEDYSRELGEFCDSIKVKHAYGMKFMECYQHGLLTSDKAKFVLEWEPGEETIADIRSMLSYAFYDFANNISIVVVDKDNSISVVCSIPTHLHGVFIEMVNQNRPALEKAKVLSITLGMCILFKRKEEDKNVLPAKKTFEGKKIEGEKEQKEKMAVENEEVMRNLQSRIRSLEHNDVRKIPVIKRDGRLHMMEHSSNSTRKPNTDHHQARLKHIPISRAGYSHQPELIHRPNTRAGYIHQPELIHRPNARVGYGHDHHYSAPLVTSPQSNSRRVDSKTSGSSNVPFKGSYEERKLNPPPVTDAQLPLTVENYRKKMRALLYYEEEEHVSLLAKNCNGHYQVSTASKEHLEKYRGRRFDAYFCLHGMTPNQILYASQASGEVYISCAPCDVKAHVLYTSNNYNDKNELLCIGTNLSSAHILQKNFNRGESANFKVRFEVKHSYFNSLHRSINQISKESIKRIIPSISDDFEQSLNLSRIPKSPFSVNKLDGFQFRALRTMVFSRSTTPVLVPGPFGSGKTRLLSVASEYFITNAKEESKCCRILLCCHHQDSADIFMNDYFKKMLEDEKNPWQVEVIRIVSFFHTKSAGQHSMLLDKFRERADQHLKNRYLVIVTTFMTALQLSDVLPPGFFTHILIDEGAQAREPECIAPLCMADKNTRIIIVGDAKQVGPKLVVLGKVAQDNGLGDSLLERLHKSYMKIRQAKPYSVTLCNNYRCSAELLDLSSSLFYDSSLKACNNSIPCIRAYPLGFICSSLSKQCMSFCENETEASIIVQEITTLICIHHICASAICVMSPSQRQVTLIRKLLWPNANIKGVKVLSSYQMQGQEFDVLLLSTVECVLSNGKSFDPLKSLCHPAVFNTAITRARSLVIAVGNPNTLIRCEEAMGSSFGCWREFISRCKSQGTYDDQRIKQPDMRRISVVQDDSSIATLPSYMAIHGQRTFAREDSDKKCSSNNMTKDVMHKTMSTPEDKKELPKSMKEKSTHIKAQRSVTKFNPREKPDSHSKKLDDCEQTFRNSQSNTTAITDEKIPNGAFTSVQNDRRKGKTNNGNIEITSNVRVSATKNQKGFKTANMKGNKTQKPPSKKQKAKLQNDLSSPRSNYETHFPSLQAAKNTPKNYAKNKEFTEQEKPFEFKGFRHKHEAINQQLLKANLCKENYRSKFHQLLCREEEEHERILKKKCNGAYEFHVYHHGFRFDDFSRFEVKSNHVRFGHITADNIDGDKVSYAKQASEGKVIIKIQKPRGGTLELNVDIVGPESSERIYLGMDASQESKLGEIYKHTNKLGQIFRDVEVVFILKYSYFDRLHVAVDQISDEVICKLFPEAEDDFSSQDCWNEPVSTHMLDCVSDYVVLDQPYFKKKPQLYALKAVLKADPSKAPVLIAGSFGTGKTRLIARAAYQILYNDKKAKVLVCAHHQKSVDLLLDNYFGKMFDAEWYCESIVRYIPNPHNKIKNPKYPKFYETKESIKNIPKTALRLVLTTFSSCPSLLGYPGRKHFTHILLDEGAQTREPETIIPLGLASKNTKIIIAGDHKQVGPSILVLGEEARENGLKFSLLERLHKLYSQEELREASENHCVSLLTNFRSHHALLSLPSYLFYGSALITVAEATTQLHPDAEYPIHFVCSSLDEDVLQVEESVNEKEVSFVLGEVRKYVENWPKNEWGRKNLKDICVIATTANQKHHFRKVLKQKHNKNIKDVELLTVYDIQGSEFQAIFLSTAEPTWENGASKNPTKSPCGQYVFNTAITRAKSLVVCVGNPFLLMKIEGKMKNIEPNFWRHYIRRCMTTGTFHVPSSTTSNLSEILKTLQELVFPLSNSTSIENLEQPKLNDSIIERLQQFVSKRRNYQECKLKILEQQQQNFQDWEVVRRSDGLGCQQDEEEISEDNVDEEVDCELLIKTPRHAIGIPVNSQDETIIINGYSNRRGAFHGDLVTVRVLGKNENEQRFGKVIRVNESCHPTKYVCRADQQNIITFYPIDRLVPAIVNLPKISSQILQYKPDEVNESQKNYITVFEESSIDTDSEELQLQIKELIPLEVAPSLLFIVKVLSWSPKYRKPLGAVIEALPQTNNMLIMEKLLKVAHDIHHDDVPESDYSDLPIPELNTDQLKMYHHAITIDPPDAINLDDALSFVPFTSEPNTYELAVLIIDVTKYIDKDSKLDRVAQMHATTVYAGQKHHASCNALHMLPSNYTTSRLSLSCDKIRPVIVVSAKVKIENGIIIEVSVQNPNNALMKPAINLSYRSSRQIMNGLPQGERNLESKIQSFETTSALSLKNTLDLLFKVAMKLRIDRLNEAAYSYQVSDPEDEEDWQSHLLVEELMIWANSCVAQYMLQECPDIAILRRQFPPLQEDLHGMLTAYKNVLEFSLCFKSLIPIDKELEINQEMLQIPYEIIEHLKLAYEKSEISEAMRILSREMNFPQLAMIEMVMILVSRSAEYICSASNYPPNEEGLLSDTLFHYSIKRHYTHFSSPIRRYFDIIVQRILNALINHDDIPYDSEELKSLCRIINFKTKMAKRYSKDIDKAQMAFVLENEGMKKTQAYIACSLDKKQKFHLCFPFGQYNLFMQKEDTTFDLSQLNYSMKDDDGVLWQIVSVPFNGPDYLLKCPNVAFAEETSNDITINIFPMENDGSKNRKHKKVIANVKNDIGLVTSETWELAHKFVKGSNNKETLKQFIDKLPDKSPVTCQSPSDSVVSDFNDSPLIQYSVRMKFGLGSIVNAWIGKSIKRPIPSPSLHLIEVAPSVRICLQHTQSPALCFSDTQLQLVSRKFFRSEKEYVDLWTKALLAEASHEGVRSKKIILLKDAHLKWPTLKPDTCLDKVHCRPIDPLVLEITEEKMDMMDFINIKPGDLVCARYELPNDEVCNAVYHFVIKKLSDHGSSTKVNVLMNAVGEHGCRVSEKMKQVLESNPKCEVQIMKMSDSFNRLFYRLQCFREKAQGLKKSDEDRVSKHEEWSDFASCVALGTEKECIREAPPLKKEFLDIFHNDKNASNLWESENLGNELNEVQKKAIKLALVHRFQLIQGPPGTGKSVTGAHLAYIFAKGNQRAANGQSVLYCGPSNKAVDVVHDQLIKLNKKLLERSRLKILRLYGRTHERKDYPDPIVKALELHFNEEEDKRCQERFRSYALHHKIRERNSAFQDLEQSMLTMMRQKKLVPSAETRKEYKKMLREAEEMELKEPYDIILCTCNETCSKRLLKALRRGDHGQQEGIPLIAQCIVDECGMANEPETLAAISKCQHAVLIGDHKQLQPVVKYQAARECGLSRSLFERYAEIKCENLITLTVQYRMHTFICEGPSEIFYNGELIADSSLYNRIPPGNLSWLRSKYPIKFYDIIGKESDLKEEVEHKGNVDAHSKLNIIEAEKTISVIQGLLGENLSCQNIAVLTPYAAQKTKIKEELKKKKLTDIRVSSIIESQGDEYDVVILSTVRSLPLSEIKVRKFVQPDQRWMRNSLGFLTDVHQTNVGITRARYGLIIIGNRTLLEYDEVWKKLIQKFERCGCLEICR